MSSTTSLPFSDAFAAETAERLRTRCVVVEVVAQGAEPFNLLGGFADQFRIAENMRVNNVGVSIP